VSDVRGDVERRLIEVVRQLAAADQEALVWIAERRRSPVELEFNKGAPEVATANEYASSLANRAVSQVGELLRLGERASLSPAKGIVAKGGK
jgi:hypothetical protein